MSQAEMSRLVSKLRINIKPRHRNLKNPKGPEGRLQRLAQTVSALIKYERLELNRNRADEARGYAERLISEALRHGDKHGPTMELATFWMPDQPQLLHKLFKVLVPRYRDHTSSYTRLLSLSSTVQDGHRKRAVLELKGNPFPPLIEDHSQNRNLLHNILLEAAKKDYKEEKIREMEAGLVGGGSGSGVGRPEGAVEAATMYQTCSQEEAAQAEAAGAEASVYQPGQACTPEEAAQAEAVEAAGAEASVYQPGQACTPQEAAQAEAVEAAAGAEASVYQPGQVCTPQEAAQAEAVEAAVSRETQTHP